MKTPSSWLHKVGLRDESVNQGHTILGRQLYFLWVLSFITLVFDRNLDSLSHFFYNRFAIPDRWLYQHTGCLVDLKLR